VQNFSPRWDGPYRIIKTHPESSSYTLDLPPDHNNFLTYHAAELKLHIPNDAILFPSREHTRPGPILTPNGLHEHKIEQIIDSQPHNCRYQFLVRWKGYGPEDDEWLMACLLEDCEALTKWYDTGGDGLGSTQYLPSGV
jgi:hypothetical protein